LISWLFFQSDFHIAVWTGNFLSKGMGRKFNMFLAKEAGHFQVFRFAQGDGRLAVWAGDLLAEILNGKLDMHAACRARHLQQTSGGIALEGKLLRRQLSSSLCVF
jgi:hypothetical protein